MNRRIVFLFKMLLMLAMLMSNTACADEYRIISLDRLPEVSRIFINDHFSESKPLLVKYDDFSYEVIFESGVSVEFDLQGKWKEVNCPGSIVPPGIVPDQIRAKIHELYPKEAIIAIERDSRGYDIRLSNRVELEFNKYGNLVDIDQD